MFGFVAKADIVRSGLAMPLKFRVLLSKNGWAFRATLISYGQHKGDQADVAVVPAAHLDWIEQLPLMHVDMHRVFVHAGIDPSCSLDQQDAEDVIWKIYRDDDDGGHGQRHVVHGHHQHAHGPVFKEKRTNLDTFAWYTGRLAIGVFDDDTPGGPIEVLEVNGEPITKILSSRRSTDMPITLSDVCF